MHHVSYSFLSGFKVLRIKLQDGLVWWPPKQTRSLKLLYFWVIAQLLSHVWLFAIPWTIQPMRLLCLRFPRQEYWSGLTFPSPGHLPLTEIKPMSLALSDSSPVSHQGSPYLFILKKILVLYSYLFFFGCVTQHVGSQFPDQGSNPCPFVARVQNLNHWIAWGLSMLLLLLLLLSRFSRVRLCATP